MEILKSHRAFAGEVMFAKHASTITQTDMQFSVFVPEKPATSCLLWLSGLTCTEENFITKAGALEYLNQHQMMLVCPDTSPRGLDLPGEHDNWDFGSGASFYVDAVTPGYKDHYRMQRYILDELYPFINQQYALNHNIALSGHSMGGHGALTIGLSNPDLFSSISAFAPIVNPTNCPWGKKAFTGYLGDDETLWQRYDACALIENGHNHPKPILISQGLADEFLETELKTQSLIDACNNSEQVLEVNFAAGYDHSYYFISSFIKQHIDFHRGSGIDFIEEELGDT